MSRNVTSAEIIENSVKAGFITERDLLLILHRMNRGIVPDWSKIWYNPIELTPEQNEKGFAWLMNLYKTPKGKERKNNPFGLREMNVLDNFSHFELVGYYDAGNRWASFFVPIYRVVGLPRHPDFDYYVSGGQIHIIG